MFFSNQVNFLESYELSWISWNVVLSIALEQYKWQTYKKDRQTNEQTDITYKVDGSVGHCFTAILYIVTQACFLM
jgi:hypothetical protein